MFALCSQNGLQRGIMKDGLKLNFQAEKFKVFVRFMINVAKEKRCVTYSEIENVFGLSHEAAGFYAGALGHYCLFKKLRALNSLIISSTECIPSDGFDWYFEQYKMSWGEMVSSCFREFHVTQAPSKRSQDFGGRDSDVQEWLGTTEAESYLTGNFDYEK
jgi:hypothetical protein